MLSKNKIKLITSLSKKKGRETHGLFIAEGNKIVRELLDSCVVCNELFATEDWIEKNRVAEPQTMCSDKELKQISQLTTPQQVIGIFEIPKYTLDFDRLSDELTLFLDEIQDPGNLGTIIRLANWFGIENIVCAIGTVDAFSPKVVQASMGAIAGVKLHYERIETFFGKMSASVPVFGTFMDGENIYKKQLPETGLIVLGNEGNGITRTTEKYVTERIAIPKMNETASAESLNVAMAASIVCSEFKRDRL